MADIKINSWFSHSTRPYLPITCLPSEAKMHLFWNNNLICVVLFPTIKDTADTRDFCVDSGCERLVLHRFYFNSSY